MKKGKNLKVRTKLILGFTICIIANLVLAFTSVNMVELSQKVNENRFRYYGKASSIIAMAYAEFNSIRINSATMTYVYEDDAKKQQNAISEVEEHTELLKTYLSEFEENMKDSDTALVAAYNTLHEDMEAYLDVIENVKELTEDGKLKKARTVLVDEAVEAGENVESLTLEVMSQLTAYGNENSEQLKTQISGLKLIQSVVGLIGCFVALSFEIGLVKDVRLSIAKLSTVAAALAAGDVSVEVEKEKDDEFGALMDEMAVMADSIRKQAEIARQISEGNLTVEVMPKSEKDVLGMALKKLVDENNIMMHHIRESSMQVTTGADQVASASQSLAQGTTEQASAVEEVSASIVEIAEKTKVNAGDANEANRLVMETKEDAVRGNAQMQEMIHAMDEINESSENISKIIKVIDDIAFQTNILALNAAVEAARAGTHGKGFAVVAEEVRNLAGKSASAASETAEMIEDSIAKVENGARLAQETAAALEHIVAAVDNIVDLVSGIATASNEQATAIAQIDQAISQVSQVVQTDSATSEQCAAASEQLANQAEKLRELISGYRLKEMKYNSYFGDSYDKGSYGKVPQISLDDDVYRLEDNGGSAVSFTGGYGKY